MNNDKIEVKEFDYGRATAEIERLLSLIEDPDSPLEEVEKAISASKSLIADGKAWLRTEKQKIKD